jgi:enoyl-[acyl-carrier protein] reductase II
MKTKATELLGIEFPIIQGAMAWISTPDLVAAVSNAGGAGVLVTNWGPERLRVDIRKVKEMTDKPFGVNTSFGSRDMNPIEARMKVILEEKVDFVTMGAGDPRPLIPALKDAGIKTIGIVPNTRLAKRLESVGVDMLIVEGTESGGRIGTLTTMALMSNVIPEVHIPVLAAGGIVDGRGLAAALIMGAGGVQMGSRFLLAEECRAYHSSNVERIMAATDEDSISIGLSRGKGMRGLRSPFSVKYTEMEVAGLSTDELNSFAADMSRKVAESGVGPEGMNGIVQVGQGVGRLKKIQSAKAIIEEVVKDAEELLRNAPGLLGTF